jgi:hypothetical protein
VTVRRKGSEAIALRAPSPQRRHVGLDPGLIDKHQTVRIEAGLLGLPAPPPASDVGASLLKGKQSLFEPQPLPPQEQP